MLTGTTAAACLLAVLAAIAWRLRQSRPNDHAGLTVMERCSLGGSAYVATVSAAGRRFLIGGGAEGVRLLAELDAVDEREPSNNRTSAAHTEAAFLAAKGGEL